MNLEKFSNNEIIHLYWTIIKELKNRKIVRTKNLLWDLWEYLTINQYNSTPWFPNLQLAPAWTHNIDAISRNGERYSIKSITWKTTGAFYWLNDKEYIWLEKQLFEYVVIVTFWDDYILDKILEINWETFIEFKKWHSTMRWWNLTLTKKLLEKSKIIYQNNVT